MNASPFGHVAIGAAIGNGAVAGDILYVGASGVLAQAAVTGLVKGNGSTYAAAVAGTDYLAPTGNGSQLTGITEGQVTNLVTDLAAKAADSAVVHRTGNLTETITGAKTFTASPTISYLGPVFMFDDTGSTGNRRWFWRASASQFDHAITDDNQSVGTTTYLTIARSNLTITSITFISPATVAFAGSIFVVGAVTIGNGTAIQKLLSASATLDFPSVAAGGQQELTMSVTGAAVNDPVEISRPAALETGLIVTARVTAADTVTVRVSNITAGAIDPASATYRAAVWKF